MTSVKKLHYNFKGFRQKLRHIWEEYNLVEYYAPFLHKKIKSEEVESFEFVPFLSDNTNIWKTTKSKSLSVLGQVKKNSLHNRVLLDAIGAFEDNLCTLVKIVYLDYPAKLKSFSSGGDSSREDKLINIIVDSEDKDEILSRVVEEKIRSIFYGNPLDFFIKDKSRLEFGDYFKNECKDLLKEYTELTARRNIIVHNSGRVDRKYIREVKGTTYKLGNKAKINTEYLKNSLFVLEGLVTMATVLVVENIYKDKPQGKLARSLRSFNVGVGKKM